MGAARVAGSALGAGTRGRAPQASQATSAVMAGGKSGNAGGSPAWAQRMQQRRQQATRDLATAAYVARSSDRGGGGPGPKLGGD